MDITAHCRVNQTVHHQHHWRSWKHRQRKAAPVGLWQCVYLPKVAGFPAISDAKCWVTARLLSRILN